MTACGKTATDAGNKVTANIVPWQGSCLLVGDGADGVEKQVMVQSGRNKGENQQQQGGRWCKGGDTILGPDGLSCSSEHDRIRKCPCMAKEGHTGSRVELGVRTLCLTLANRMEPHCKDKCGGEIVEPASVYHDGQSCCCICMRGGKATLEATATGKWGECSDE